MGKCKRVFAFALTFVMILACAACGKNKKTLALNEKQMASKDYVYSCEKLNIKPGKDRYNYMQINYGHVVGFIEECVYPENNDDFMVQPRDMEEDAESDVDSKKIEDLATEDIDNSSSGFEYNGHFRIFDGDGKSEGEVRFSSKTEGTVTGFRNDEEGNIYFIYNEYGAKDNGADNLVLYGYSRSGDELFNVPLGENVNSDDWYTANIIYVEGGRIYVQTNKGLDVFNTEDGALVYDVLEEAVYHWADLYKLRDGSYAALIYDDMDDPYLGRVDLNTGKTVETISLPFDTYTYSIYEGRVHDLVMNAGGGVYTFNIGDSEPKLIMDTVASDCESEYLQRIYEIDEKIFLASWYDMEMQAGKFIKVEPSEIKDKTQLTLGVINLDDDVRRHILDFNKSSDEYKIVVKYYRSEGGYDEMIEQINNDIISGNMPDVLVVPTDINIKNYISKGLIEDLYPFMDADADIDRDDYLQNIFEACSEGEHMYQMIPRFYLQTVVAKKEFVGDRDSMTMAEMEEIISSHPEINEDFATMSKNDFITSVLRYNINQFVNWETGEVKFNTDEFIKVLEHTDRYPKEIQWGEITDDYWAGYDTMYVENRALFDMAYIYDCTDYASLKQGTFGNADISFIGFPNDHGKGNVACQYTSMMLSSKSPCKEGAWEFLKYFLMDEYQSSITSGLPVKVSALNAAVEKAKKVNMIEDEDGKLIENPNTFWINGAELELKPITDADAEELLELIYSIDALSSSNVKIEEIINEEAASYYSGQKSAADVAKIIQSRVQIYVDETR